MNDASPIPFAQPVAVPQEQALATVTRVPPTALPPEVPSASAHAVIPRRRDGFAVASAICGFTAIVPFASQVVGLTLGVLSLVRIRRARQRGVELSGTGWAITGITSSGFVLICWIGIVVALSMVSSTFSTTADSFGAAIGSTR